MNIRQANPSDQAPLWGLFQEVVKEGTAFLTTTETLDRDKFLAVWFSPDGATYVAEENGKLAGGYTIHPNKPGRGNHIATATYMVSPDWRGQGIGTLLGENLIQVAHDRGFTALQFNTVVSTNSAAVKLCQKLGFSVIGIVPQGFQHPTLGLVDTYIMHRTV